MQRYALGAETTAGGVQFHQSSWAICRRISSRTNAHAW